METQFTRRDFYFIIACVFTASVSLAVGTHFFYSAFPEASIDFAITRQQAHNQAQSFLTSHGLDTAGFRHSALFRYSNSAKTFLERELGLAGATARINNPVRLWRWSNRWVKEQQKEEFHVSITTSGELVGFTRLIEEDQAGASWSQDDARQLATAFLTNDLGHALDKLDFDAVITTQRKNRTDHSFVWKLKDFEINGATYRYHINVQGDQIGGFGEHLKVPETWSRQYQELRARNELTGLIASIFLFFTWVALIAVFIGRIRQRDVRWKTAGIFAAIAYLLTFLAGLNNMPVSFFNYDTTDTYTSFLVQSLLGTLVGALAAGAGIGLLVAAAEPVYRTAFGSQVSVSRLFTLNGIRTKRFFLGVVLGLTLTAAFFAYQTVFYTIAQRFGAWSPADIPYSEMVNTYFPWITVLLIGFMPAVSEEFTSRAFSIPFFGKYLKSRWAAVLLAAVIWGFAHAGYPQQPFYIRGVEVGLVGIIIGLVVLRWGLLPALVWHYTIDALYTGLILIRSSNSYFTVSAIISAGLTLVPLALALFLYIKHRRFADPSPLLNRADPQNAEFEPSPLLARPAATAPQNNAAAIPPLAFTPLSRRRLLVAFGLTGIAALAFFLPVEKPLAFVDYHVTRTEALAKAVHFLEAKGIALKDYKSVLTQRHQADGITAKYILEHQSYAGYNALYQNDLAPSLWLARFYRPGQKEEYQVAIHPTDGSIYTFNHLVEEDGEGADLSKADAQALATDHLRAFGLDPDRFVLKESSSKTNLKGRRDHNFVWQAPEDDPRHVAAALYRCEVSIKGNAPTSLRRHLKLPEDWLRARAADTAWRTGLKFVPPVLIIAALIHLIWLLIRHIRQDTIPWRLTLIIGAVSGMVFLLGFVNTLPTLDSAYDTAMPYGIWRATQAIIGLMGLVGIALMTAIGLALCSGLYPDWPVRLHPLNLGRRFNQALLIVPVALIATQVQQHLTLWLKNHYASYTLAPGASLPNGLDALLPFLGGLQGGLTAAVMTPLGMGIGLYYLCRFFPKPVYALALGTVMLLAGAAAPSFSLGEFGLSLGLSVLTWSLTLLLVAILFRDNIAAYILWGFAQGIYTGAVNLLGQSASLYQVQGLTLLIIGFACIIGFGLWLKNASKRFSR